MRKLFRRWVLARPWLTFIVMGLSFLVFGSGTINLIQLFQANAVFIARHGWQAVMQGALLQLVELVTNGVISIAAYIVFKACEQRLAFWLAEEE